MVYVFLADGFEEIEALAVVDILRRADVNVRTVGVTGDKVTGSHGISVLADIPLSDVKDDGKAYVLPGGMPGTENLYKSEALRGIIKNAYEAGKYICAICAAPIILGRLGLLNGKNACCFPGFEEELKGARVLPDKVCADGTVITAKGAGAAHLFAFKILELIKDSGTANRIKSAMQYE